MALLDILRKKGVNNSLEQEKNFYAHMIHPVSNIKLADFLKENGAAISLELEHEFYEHLKLLITRGCGYVEDIPPPQKEV